MTGRRGSVPINTTEDQSTESIVSPDVEAFKKLKSVSAAAAKYVTAHRRKESLAEKLLLGPIMEDEAHNVKSMLCMIMYYV